MSEKKKVLILDSTSVRGPFYDRGDIVEVSAQVANDLINERKGTTNEAAIAAREAELAAGKPAGEAASAKPSTENASAAPKAEKKVRSPRA